MNNYPLLAYMPSDAYNTDAHQVNGRRIAGKLLLQAFASSLHADELLTVVAPGGQQNRELASILKPVLPPAARVQLHSGFSQAVCSGIGTVFRPDPALTEWVDLRAALPANAFSLIGVIHTLCSRSVLRSIAQLVTSDVRSWDALICTSVAGQKVVRAVLHYKAEQLAKRFGVPALNIDAVLPQLPVIPLPATTKRSPSLPDEREAARHKARRALAIRDDEFVLASVGRLSFHSKAHPLALYRVLNSLSGAKRQICLVECGHCINEPISSCYQEARSLFPDLRVLEVGGLSPATEDQKQQVLAAADVFVSLADSIQETFGLSLLEAMDAGLPIIATDWNGYKDLVADGTNGFLIPCSDVLLDSAVTNDQVGQLYSLGVLDYESMLALRSSGVVVDEQALRASIEALMASPQLCLSMGQAGRERLERHFSPSVVASLYRELCSDLQHRRRSVSSDAIQQLPEFSFPAFFASYPSSSLHPECIVLAPQASPQLAGLAMNVPLLNRVPGLQTEVILKRFLETRILTRAELISAGHSEAVASLILASFVKYGLAIAE